MSAIALPFLAPSGAVSGIPINIELCHRFVKAETEAGPNTEIWFFMGPDTESASKFIWKYALNATRNTKYTALVTAAVTTV